MSMTNETRSLLHYHPSLDHHHNENNSLVFGQQSSRTTPSPVYDASIMNTYSKAYNNGLPYFMPDGVDDDEVKRPMNSFLLWAKIMRKKYASENPNMHNAEISKLLGKIWNSMTTKDKRPFVEQAEKLRVLHMRTYPNYRYAPKKRKERRSQKMISPEVAAALHSTLFDVKNIISEQLSQNKQMLGHNLKSYGYLRNAFQQKTSMSAENTQHHEAANTTLDSGEKSPVSHYPSRSPSSSPTEYTNMTSLTSEIPQHVHGKTGDESCELPTFAKSTESLTLHYYPAGMANASSRNNEIIESFTMPHTNYYFNRDSSVQSPSELTTSDASGSEDDEQAIGKEFSYFLESSKTPTSSDAEADLKRNDRVTGGNDGFFWIDIVDIMKNGSL